VAAAFLAAKARQLLLPWSAALGLSALLVAAGRRWPQPLLAQPWALAHPELPLQLALALVLLPPLLLGLVLLVRMRQPGLAEAVAHPGRGESSDCAQGER
jgi:type VI protein secretion system component VasK